MKPNITGCNLFLKVAINCNRNYTVKHIQTDKSSFYRVNSKSIQVLSLECKWANKVLALSKIWQIAPVGLANVTSDRMCGR